MFTTPTIYFHLCATPVLGFYIFLPRSCKSGGDGGASSPLVGRVRALSIMLFSVVLAVAGQYWWYEFFDETDAWEDG